MGTTPTTTKKSTAKITGFTSEAARTNAIASGRISASEAKNLPIEKSSYSSNPVSSSTSVRSDIRATGADVSKLTKAYREEKALLQQQQAALAERRATEVAGIKSEFDIAKSAQELGQAGEYASRATQLVTSGGGFLGATQSQQGVLQNLSNTHEAEKTALLAKREAAINAANTAYEDKDFALAREMVQSAKDLQKEIYIREKDFADQMLKNTTYAKDKAESLATLSDQQFNNLSPATISAIDQYYYPGYAAATRNIAKKALDVKTNKDAVALDADILDMRLKIPAGQKFTLNGNTYTGLKQADGGTAQERKDSAFQKISEILSGKTNTQGTPLYTIPGTKGVPYTDSQGYLTPEGWVYAVKNFGVSPKDLIDNYAHLFNPKYLDNYQLSEVQKNLIRPKL